MSNRVWERRDFLKTLLAGLPLMAWDWDRFPRGGGNPDKPGTYDAVVIGAGLGGLSAAAAFARQGYKVVVLEQHSIPGGYATSFRRRGGFTFDVSLHSTTVGLRDGVPNLISGFPEIRDVVFVPHKVLYRAVYPDLDIRVPAEGCPRLHRDPQGKIPRRSPGNRRHLRRHERFFRRCRQIIPGRRQGGHVLLPDRVSPLVQEFQPDLGRHA